MSTGTLARSGRTRPGSAPVIDPRLQARRREVARGKGRRRLRRLVAAVVVVLVGGSAYAATRSSLLDVDHVRLSGVEGDRADAVIRAAAIRRGTPLLDVDAGTVAGRVEALAWVADVSVERRWPGTVALAVTEREAVAVDATGSGLDVTGRSLGPVAGAAGLPTVRDASIDPGQELPAELAPVLDVLAELPAGLGDEVESAALVDDDVELVLVDGIRVRFGPSERHRAKFTALDALLDQADRSSIRAIDLRVPTSPSLTRRAGTGA